MELKAISLDQTYSPTSYGTVPETQKVTVSPTPQYRYTPIYRRFAQEPAQIFFSGAVFAIGAIASAYFYSQQNVIAASLFIIGGTLLSAPMYNQNAGMCEGHYSLDHDHVKHYARGLFAMMATGIICGVIDNVSYLSNVDYYFRVRGVIFFAGNLYGADSMLNLRNIFEKKNTTSSDEYPRAEGIL